MDLRELSVEWREKADRADARWPLDGTPGSYLRRCADELDAALSTQPVRPECFEFAMDFLGDPEATAVRSYVEALEAASLSARSAEGPQDWQDLLKRYISHVDDREGSDFLEPWRNQSDFTHDEWMTLRVLAGYKDKEK